MGKISVIQNMMKVEKTNGTKAFDEETKKFEWALSK